MLWMYAKNTAINDVVARNAIAMMLLGSKVAIGSSFKPRSAPAARRGTRDLKYPAARPAGLLAARGRQVCEVGFLHVPLHQ